jgi:MFS family permease
MLSSLIQLIATTWSMSHHSGGELIAVNLLPGIGVATSETIAMITIVDLISVRQHARFNGIFLSQRLGAFGGPVAAGFIVDNRG